MQTICLRKEIIKEIIQENFLEVQDMSVLTGRTHRAPNMMIEISQHWKQITSYNVQRERIGGIHTGSDQETLQLTVETRRQ